MGMSYRQFLRKEFALRRAKNPSYSLRALARDLEVNPASLSQVLANKRELSQKNLKKIAVRLGLSPKETKQLLSKKSNTVSDHEQLQEDTFHLMADWYYFAILNLAKLKGAKGDPDWVAQRLGIKKREAKKALEGLTRLGFIKVTQGQMKRTAGPLKTTEDVPSVALKHFADQHLDLAKRAIWEVPIEEKEITTITMAINPERVKEAKAKIKEFRNELSDFLEKGKAGKVYTLAIQLFPLSD